MAQYHESIPSEKRLSKNIGVWDFLKEMAPAFTAGLVGVVAGSLKDVVEKGSPKARMLSIISVVSLAISPFLLWRKQEKENLGIRDLYDQYKEARALRMTNDDVERDNAMLRKMVAYEERQIEHHKTPKHVQDILAHGAKKHIDHTISEVAEKVAAL